MFIILQCLTEFKKCKIHKKKPLGKVQYKDKTLSSKTKIDMFVLKRYA